MAALRELVTYLRYKVDPTGLKDYVRQADKAADDINKAAAKIKPPSANTGGALPSKGPNGEPVRTVDGKPGYFKTTGGKPTFVPLTPGGSGGASEGLNFKMPGAEAIAVAERDAQRQKLRAIEREANDEARAQQTIANAERDAQRKARDEQQRAQTQATREREQIAIAERNAMRQSMAQREAMAQAERQAQRQSMRQREAEARALARDQARGAREQARIARETARAEAIAARAASREQIAAQRTVSSTGGGALGGIRGLLGGALGVLGIGFGLHQISHIADEWSTVNARIGLVTNSTKEQKEVLNDVYDIANRTRQEYGETANLIFNMRQATEHAGISMKDTLSAAENFNKALIIGGGTAANNRRAIYELNHALEVGKLGGMQLRSLRMEAPIFTRMLTNTIAGGDAEKFNEMAKHGLVTTKLIIDALNKNTAELDAKFRKMPLTIGQATTVAGNMFGKLISDIGQTTGAFQDFAHAIVWVTELLIGGFRAAAEAVGGFGNLARLAAIAIGSLVGAKIITGAWELVKAIRAGGLAALIMEAPFWLVVAAIAAVLLLLDDIWAWFQGKDSLLGSWLDDIANFLKMLRDVGAFLTKDLLEAISKVGQWIEDKIGGPLKKAIDLFHQLVPGMPGSEPVNPNNASDLRNAVDTNNGANPNNGGIPGLNLGKRNGGGLATFMRGAANSPSNNAALALTGSPGSFLRGGDLSQVYNTTVQVSTADNPQAVGAAAARGAQQGAQAGAAGRNLGTAYPNAEAK